MLACLSARQVEYDSIVQRCQPLFMPLAKLLDSPFRPFAR